MRATDGLQTTMTLGPVNVDGQTISLELLLDMSLYTAPPGFVTSGRLATSMTVGATATRGGLSLDASGIRTLVPGEGRDGALASAGLHSPAGRTVRGR